MTTADIKLSKILRKGIYFSCIMCGACCRGLNEGEVYLYEEDIKKLANHLKLKGIEGLREFTKKYLKIIDDNYIWKEIGEDRRKTYRFKTLAFKFTGDDEQCHFLKENKCSVHEVRPFQCQCFPFWQMMVSSRLNFTNYSKKCPGLKELKGNFYSKENILEWAIAERKLEMDYFLKMKANEFNILKVYPFLPKDLLENEGEKIKKIIEFDGKYEAKLIELIADFRVDLARFRGFVRKRDLNTAKEEFDYYKLKKFPIFLAIGNNDELVGYTVCRIQDNIVWDESLYVIPDKRRSGIGSALFAEAEKCAEKFGRKTLYNWVDPNNHKSIPFLKKKGYTVLNLIELRKKLPDEKLTQKINVGNYEFDH